MTDAFRRLFATSVVCLSLRASCWAGGAIAYSPPPAGKRWIKPIAPPPASEQPLNWQHGLMFGLVVTGGAATLAYGLGYGHGRASQANCNKLESPQELPNAATVMVDSASMFSGKPDGPLDSNPSATRLAKIDRVETLIRDLPQFDPTQRRKAIWELGQRGDSRALQPLVDLMLNADSQQRSLILAAIAEIGIRTLKPMNRALLLSIQDESVEVRKNGIRDVTRVYDLLSQLNQLLHHANSDPDPEVQETAQWAIGQLNRIRDGAGLVLRTED
jgi:hypothetical protein